MCAPCGYNPRHQDRCQDIGNPHAAEETPSSGPVQPSLPRMGRRSTICCGWDFITAEDALAHRENH